MAIAPTATTRTSDPFAGRMYVFNKPVTPLAAIGIPTATAGGAGALAFFVTKTTGLSTPLRAAIIAGSAIAGAIGGAALASLTSSPDTGTVVAPRTDQQRDGGTPDVGTPDADTGHDTSVPDTAHQTTERKYNPYSNDWEDVPSNYELKYNPMENSWSYAAPDASPVYNPMENKWEQGRPGDIQRYNPMTNKWETASPTAELKYDPLTNTWSYV